MGSLIRRTMLTAAVIASAFACARRTPSPITARRGGDAEAVARRGSMEDVLLLSGEVEAVSAENLVVPRTDTWILTVRWLPQEGDHIDKGDRVVEFDNSALVSRVQEKTYAVDTAVSELARQEAADDITEAQKHFDARKAEVAVEKARIDASVPKDTVSERDYAQRQLTLKQAEQALEKANEELATQLKSDESDEKVKHVDLDNAKRELDDAKRTLDSLTLMAPTSGIVVIGNNWEEGRKYQIGDTAHPGMVVASLPNLDRLRVRARLSDVDEGSVTVGMQTRSILDAYPDVVYPGTIDSVSPVARALSRESTQQYFSVTVSLPDTETKKMRPGMSVRVEIVRRHSDSVVIVPRRALDLSGDTAIGYTRTGRLTIPIDWCNVTDCAAKSGVAEGARLLVGVEEAAH